MITKVKENLIKIKEQYIKLPGPRDWVQGLKGLVSRLRLLFSRTADKQQPQSPSPEPRAPAPFRSWLKKSGETVSNLLASLENRFLNRFPEKQRRLLLLGIGGTALLFITLLISIPVTLSGRTSQTVPVRTASGFFIPANELFFPSEPVFFPEFILEREPRNFWILEDIRPYWRNLDNTELWRDQIKSVVDRLMESVP